jgi:RimJ/RimL family protein N-acetyltransferase
MTKAIKKIVEYSFNNSKIIRIYAGIFENNKTSAHVLTKAGFNLEAVHKNGVIKNGLIMNELVYAILK